MSTFTFHLTIPHRYPLSGVYKVTVHLHRDATIETWEVTHWDGAAIADADFDSIADEVRPHLYQRVNALTTPVET